MTSALLDLPGAVAAEGVDAGVAAHYGDPYREQRVLLERAGIVDRSHRGVIAVPGADRLTWLHSLTTQHLERLAPWHGTEALVLSPHGHVEHHLGVLDDGSTTWLDVEPGTAAALTAYLDSMRFMLRVDPSDVTETWAILTIVGAKLPDFVPDDAAAYDDGWVRRTSQTAADLLVPREKIAATVGKLGLPVAGIWAYEALRVAERRPRLGLETDHRTIVQEPGWVPSAVHLDKGCYRGQETVARVHNLGKPPRRLVLLHLDGMDEELPAAGDPVTLGDRQVGFVGTAARHVELGQIALALVRRNTPVDAQLTIGERAAAIDPDSVPEEDRPRVERPRGLRVGPSRG
ncbi:YgfZ/GcvT domain-containing protein [Fodinicola acaciae]|uniref:CAF17-like 4Fe-4S cluster assembly/insertion protein YgfZ n=1 Tax=Fodinicola acaciae TaxID=2681555 RepID=UPI001C9E2B5A|nr:folate-binding protein [Fodinicola acaciae]